MKLLTQAQYARRKNVTRARVTQWIREGRIKLVKGKIDPATADCDLEKNLDPMRKLNLKISRQKRSPKSSPNSSLLSNEEKSLVDWKKETERLKAELLSLKVEVERGDLVPRTKGLEIVFLQSGAARISFWSMPNRLCEVLAMMGGRPKDIECLLRQEIRLIVETMVKVCSARQLQILQELENLLPDPEWESKLREARRMNDERKSQTRDPEAKGEGPSGDLEGMESRSTSTG